MEAKKINKEYSAGFKVGELFILNYEPEEISKGSDFQTGHPRILGLKPGMNRRIIETIERNLGLGFEPEPEEGNVCFAYNNTALRDDFKQVFTTLDLMNYVYAALHSPAYQEKYKACIKDEPLRVPYPNDTDDFWKKVRLGKEIRTLRL